MTLPARKPLSTQNLTATGLDHEIAAAIVGAIRESHAELSANIQDVRSELKDVRSELTTSIEDVRSELKDVRSELTTSIEDVRSELKDVRSESATSIEDVRAELAKSHAELKTSHAELAKSLAKLAESQHEMAMSIQDVRGELMTSHAELAKSHVKLAAEIALRPTKEDIAEQFATKNDFAELKVSIAKTHAEIGKLEGKIGESKEDTTKTLARWMFYSLAIILTAIGGATGVVIQFLKLLVA